MNNDIDNELARLEEALKASDPELAKQLEALTAEAKAEDSAEEAADTDELDYITDDADTDPEESSETVTSKKKKKKSLRGLIIYNAIIIAGIIGVLIFWYVRYNALFL